MGISGGFGSVLASALALTGIQVFAAEGAPKADAPAPKPQYSHGSILIPAFRPDEKVRAAVSPALAIDHLDQGALAWSRERRCVSCHTAGTYLVTRSLLTAFAGPPLAEVRDLYVARLHRKQAMARADLLRSTESGEAV